MDDETFSVVVRPFVCDALLSQHRAVRLARQSMSWAHKTKPSRIKEVVADHDRPKILP